MRGKWKHWQILFRGGSKITVDGDCSHEIKGHLLLGRKAMANLDSILKTRVITLPTNVHLVKAMVFPVVMYGCEGWTIKKAEWRRMTLLNCGVGEDSWESLGLQGDPTSPKGDWSFMFIGRIYVEAITPILWLPDAKSGLMKRPWWWERLREGGEGDNRG